MLFSASIVKCFIGFFLGAVITAVTTFITPVGQTSKAIPSRLRDKMADGQKSTDVEMAWLIRQCPHAGLIFKAHKDEVRIKGYIGIDPSRVQRVRR